MFPSCFHGRRYAFHAGSINRLPANGEPAAGNYLVSASCDSEACPAWGEATMLLYEVLHGCVGLQDLKVVVVPREVASSFS